ncbi:MAG: hypothetical protein AAF614_41745, partial [Chloroflexota bacterium]
MGCLVILTKTSGGIWVDDASGDIYLTTRGAFSITGLSGGQADAFVCTPSSLGTSTSCSFSGFFDGATAGIGGERTDGLHVQLPLQLRPHVTNLSLAALFLRNTGLSVQCAGVLDGVLQQQRHH